MGEYGEDTYGELIADVYDDWYAGVDPQMLEMLTRLAGGGKALELGIGTGRVAITLAESGVRMYGIDASPAMVEKLKAKEGAEGITLHLGSFVNIPFVEKFDLVYVVFNTIFALLTQEAQVRCFQTVAEHLENKGLFAVEAFIPDLSRFQGGQTVRAIQLESQQARLDASIIDPIHRVITSQHIVLDSAKTRINPFKLRYIWPSEMDWMARLAGLKLEHRWGDWNQAPFNKTSTKHISVYARM